jgi:DNA polymerase III subunit delta'
MPFGDLTGHRPLLQLLARAIAHNTLPQSLLFSGPEGVGKRTTALALAQALNCEHPSTFSEGVDACGRCRTCTRIARGVHADVLFVEPGDSGSIKIEQVRDAIDRSNYRPFEGRRRVVAIDHAEALVANAQDAILKTLEEPPPASVFVLITDRADILLPTILSRCQRLRFGPLAPAEVADVLQRDHGMSEAEARAAAAASAGSIGRAIEGSGEEAIEARAAAAKLLQGAATAKGPQQRLAGARMLTGAGGDRDDLSRRLLAMSSLVRDLGLLNAHADDRTLANADLKPQLEALLRAYDVERTLKAFSVVDRALFALDRNASPKIVADWLAMNL